MNSITIMLPLAAGIATSACTIVVHALALNAIIHFVRHERRLGRAGVRFSIDVAVVAVAIMIALAAHLIEMALWAVLFVVCGEFRDIRNLLLSLGCELHDFGLWRYRDVAQMEITGSARSCRRDADVWRINGNDFCRYSALGSDEACGLTALNTSPATLC